MISFRSNVSNVATFNKKISFEEFRHVDPLSIIGLYVSEVLLFLGILLIIFSNLNVISPGDYFGEYNWITIVVFFIGLCINFISIPFLYVSSSKNFLKENSFWDKEMFWILPLFFFGTFFIYNSFIPKSASILLLSIVTITCTHVMFLFKMNDIHRKHIGGMLANYGQYMTTLKYLSLYYVLLLVVSISFNPLHWAFSWIKLHS